MHLATERLRENCARSTLQTLDLEAAFSSSLFTRPFPYYLASAALPRATPAAGDMMRPTDMDFFADPISSLARDRWMRRCA